jgi:hypothetical protein
MKFKIDYMLEKASELYNEKWKDALRKVLIDKILNTWESCVVNYINIFKEFDKEAVANNNQWISDKRKQQWKVDVISDIAIWEMIKGMLKYQVDKDIKELSWILAKYTNKENSILAKYNTIKEFLSLDESTIRSELSWISDEDFSKILDLRNRILKIEKQSRVITTYVSLSDKDKESFLQKLDTYQKEWKDIELELNKIKQNSETTKSEIAKAYPEAIISTLSNWWAEIKLW